MSNAERISKKLNVTLKPEVLERADAYAEANGLSRSALIGLALTQYLNAVDAMPSVNSILASMAEVATRTLSGEMTPNEANFKMEAIKNQYTAIYGNK